MSVEKNMLLISSRRDGAPTFRLMPVKIDCPYIEAVYIPQATALVIFHKHQVEGFHMFPSLDSNGDPVKTAKAKANGNPYKEERKLLKTAHETYITEKEEIKAFVKLFAVNEDFDFEKFMTAPQIITPEKPNIIVP